jgi:hypothetical protein
MYILKTFNYHLFPSCLHCGHIFEKQRAKKQNRISKICDPCVDGSKFKGSCRTCLFVSYPWTSQICIECKTHNMYVLNPGHNDSLDNVIKEMV